MGKSFAAAVFRRLGIPVFDADKAVHRLLGKNGAAVEKVAARFPGAREGNAINRAALGKIVFNDKAALHVLEAIIHPLVRQEERRFLRQARYLKHPLVILEIPLLFEAKKGYVCDKVITVSASAFLQERRVMQRPGMTQTKLKAILKRQVSDFHKRLRSDYVVYTGLGKAHTYHQIKAIIHKELLCAK